MPLVVAGASLCYLLMLTEHPLAEGETRLFLHALLVDVYLVQL